MNKFPISLAGSRSTVSNLILLLQLNDAVKQLLSSGDIEMSHTRALLSLTKEQQLDVDNQVIKKSLSVRQTEEFVKKKCLIQPLKINLNQTTYFRANANFK